MVQIDRLLQRLLRDLDGALRDDHVGFARRLLAARLRDRDRREQSDADALLVLVQGLLRERQRLASHDERLTRVHHVPVRLHDALHEVRELRPIRVRRLLRVDAGDGDEEVREVQAEVPQQRLIEREHQLRLVLRPQPLERGVRDQAIVGEVDLEVGAAAQELLQGDVPVHVFRDVDASR